VRVTQVEGERLLAYRREADCGTELNQRPMALDRRGDVAKVEALRPQNSLSISVDISDPELSSEALRSITLPVA
jgi:hypothetical protein